MARQRKPEVGDMIEHTIPSLDIRRRGEVVQLLSAQFVYETEDGSRCSCLFTEVWKEVNA